MKPAAILVIVCASLAAQPASVEGTVVNRTNGQPMSVAHVRLVLGESTDSPEAYGATSDKAGHFSFPQLKPGSYLTQVEEQSEFPPRVYLTPVGTLAYAARVDVGADDTFTLPKVVPGRYRVFLSWPNVFTKSTQLGTVQTEGEILDVRNGAGGAPLTVLVSGANGNISGTVHDSKGPVAGAGVALTSDGEVSRYCRFATAGADGTYKISDVPPGKYLLLAADDDYTGLLQTGTDLADYEGVIEHIQVHAGETTEKDLKWHPAGSQE